MKRAPDTVGEIMTREVVTVEPDESVRHAVRLMVEHAIGAVIVQEARRPVGVFTERDLTRSILEHADTLDRRVGEMMSAPVVSSGPGEQIVDAFQLMNDRGIRRLAIMEDDRLVGVVTERDLLRWVGAVAAE